MYLNDITIGANLAGVPAISIRVDSCASARGSADAGPHSPKPKLLNVAHAYQKETDWHRRIPAAFAKEVLS
jgi:aspartyl-tRNA(Asn)/glutamyl-tRNA(Gln) amidotransferase subunit A